MTPKEYLGRIREYEEYIENKEAELFQLNCLATSITAPTDREAVQTSGTTDKVGNIAIKIADMSREIEALKERLICLKNECIGVIEAVRNYNTLFYDVLHKRYIQHKSLKQIAKEKNYSYNYIRHTHGEALLIVGKILKNQNTAHKNTFNSDIM